MNSLLLFRISEEGAGEGRRVQSPQLRADASVSALYRFHPQQGSSHPGDGTQSQHRTHVPASGHGTPRSYREPPRTALGDLLLPSGSVHSWKIPKVNAKRAPEACLWLNFKHQRNSCNVSEGINMLIFPF